MAKKLTAPPVLLYAAEKVGGLAQLASKLGIARQAIYQWKRVPAERCVDIERITGIPRAELRPDLFGEAADACVRLPIEGIAEVSNERRD